MLALMSNYSFNRDLIVFNCESDPIEFIGLLVTLSYEYLAISYSNAFDNAHIVSQLQWLLG